MDQLPSGHFFGHLLRSLRVADFLLSETRYPAGARLPRHCHEGAYFCLIRKGWYTEIYGRQARTCSPMTLAFHPPGETHYQQFHNVEVCSFNVEITPARLTCLREEYPILAAPMHWRGGILTALALRLYQEFAREDACSSLVMEGLVLEILGEASRGVGGVPSQRPPPWLEQLRSALHSHFAHHVSVNGLAGLAGVHPVYLARAFRHYCGCSVGEYLRRLRLEYACQRLSQSDESIAEIALAAGFADQSHLTRLIKRRTGLTPASFRRASRSR
jgi:AraC family transcriptional regulator